MLAANEMFGEDGLAANPCPIQKIFIEIKGSEPLRVIIVLNSSYKDSDGLFNSDSFHLIAICL